MPFGEQAWNHARQLLAARGSDPATEAEIAAAAADLLDRAGQGPGPDRASRHRRSRTRQPAARAHRARGGSRGRTAATAAPQWPRPADGDEDSAGQADGRLSRPRRETTPAQVIPLPLFDARKEAEKWW